MHELKAAVTNTSTAAAASKTHTIQGQISQMGFQNPLFVADSSMMSSIDMGYIDDKENEAVASQVEAQSIHLNLTGGNGTIGKNIAIGGGTEDEDTAAIRRARFARNNSTLTSQEVDLLLCDRVFTIKTRTYLNYKKTLQMLKPFGVLFALILILIFVFRVDAFVTSNVPPNPDESI